MSKDQYLEMMDQMGKDPNWDECPPDWEDFPQVVIDSVNIFHCLGDRIYPEIGYIGKDYTIWDFVLKQYNIDEHQKDYVFDLVLWLDTRKLEASQKRLKAEYDKIKRKHG